jgi:hypothetical protein
MAQEKAKGLEAEAEPRTVNPEPRTQNPEPRTQNPEPRTWNLEPGTSYFAVSEIFSNRS